MNNRVTWRTYQGHGIESRGQRLDMKKFFPSPNGKETFLDESIVDKSVGIVFEMSICRCRQGDVDGGALHKPPTNLPSRASAALAPAGPRLESTSPDARTTLYFSPASRYEE